MMSVISDALALTNGVTGFVTGATAAVKGIVEMTKKPAPDVSEIKRLAIEVIDQLLEAKAAQMTMQDALMKLQDEQKKRDRFQAEAHRYALTRTDLGAMVYSLKPDEARGEPPHDLCATCFEDQIKSVLQPVKSNTLGCNRCGGTFLKPDGRDSGIMFAPGRSTRGLSGF